MKFARFILKLFGWKLVNPLEGKMPAKAIIIAAPHTSWIDFPLAFIYYRALGVNAHFLIKKEAFIFPFAGLLKKLGGIPVNRFSKNTIVEDTVEYFKNNERFILTITPEGTRAAVKEWKSGYHRIGKAANVPVLIGFDDFKTKTVGIIQAFDLSDDFEKDTFEIMKFYKNMEGKHPEKFYLPDEIRNS
jgi:1-acyl-sn-glycerol-3-phosphate acyltransferase